MAENPEDLIVTDAELRRQLPALADELGIGGSGSGIEQVSGTVTLDASGDPIREFFTTGATTFKANGVDTPLGASTAVVWRRTSQGSWGYQVVQDAWVTPTPTPDTTAPVAGTLAVTVTDVKADLSVSGASDDRGYVSYSFSKDNGATWTAYQDSATYTFAGLTASTAYTFKHRVKDAAGNVTTGTAVSKTTTAKPVVQPSRSEIESTIMADAPHLYFPLQDTDGSVSKQGVGGATLESLGTATQGAAMKDGGKGFKYTGGAGTTFNGLAPGPHPAATVEATVEASSTRGTIAVFGNPSAGPTIGADHVGVKGQFIFKNVPTGSVVHLAMTYDGTTIRRYVNGVEDGTTTTTGGVNFGSHFALGSRSDGTQGSPGTVRDLAVYTTALPASRILAHAQAQKVA